jgi:Protein of unknown function (DUF1579)
MTKSHVEEGAGMSESKHNRQVVSVAGGLEETAQGPAQRGPEYARLDVLIGSWITEGHTVASPGAPAARILASDVYEWAAGGFFVVHPAYGRVGDAEVGGVEIVGYSADTGSYRSQVFDSFGNVSTSRLTVEGDTWTWSGERTRCTAVLSDDGKTLIIRVCRGRALRLTTISASNSWRSCATPRRRHPAPLNSTQHPSGFRPAGRLRQRTSTSLAVSGGL